MPIVDIRKNFILSFHLGADLTDNKYLTYNEELQKKVIQLDFIPDSVIVKWYIWLDDASNKGQFILTSSLTDFQDMCSIIESVNVQQVNLEFELGKHISPGYKFQIKKMQGAYVFKGDFQIALEFVKYAKRY